MLNLTVKHHTVDCLLSLAFRNVEKPNFITTWHYNFLNGNYNVHILSFYLNLVEGPEIVICMPRLTRVENPP